MYARGKTTIYGYNKAVPGAFKFVHYRGILVSQRCS